MANTGRVPPELPDDAPGEENCEHQLDSTDLAQHPGPVLDETLRTLAPGTRRDNADERAARIEADRIIAARVAAENIDGEITQRLLGETHAYATSVMGGLIGSGRIFGACKRLGRPVSRQPYDTLWTRDDRDLLTGGCVDLGIFHVFYQHGLMEGMWDASRGTALTTYAVNACIRCFPEVYRKWWRGREFERLVGDLVADVPAYLQVDLRQPDPAERVANRLDAEGLLRQMPEPVRFALWECGMNGVSQAEAAALVGLTPKALENRIRRARSKLGLTQGNPPEADRTDVLPPDPEAEPDAQEDDRDPQD